MNNDDNQLSHDMPEALISEERSISDSVTDVVLAPEAFHIDSARTANWLMRKVLERRRYRDQVKAWADAEIRHAEREEQHLLQHYGGQLEAWLRRALEERGGRRRSINLPAGMIGFRAEAARLVVNDQEALVEWCRSHLPDAVQVRIEAIGQDAILMETWAKAHCADARRCVAIGKAVVNGHFADSGEVPPGTDVIPRQDALTVK